jgi:hypothetical protein
MTSSPNVRMPNMGRSLAMRDMMYRNRLRPLRRIMRAFPILRLPAESPCSEILISGLHHDVSRQYTPRKLEMTKVRG